MGKFFLKSNFFIVLFTLTTSINFAETIDDALFERSYESAHKVEEKHEPQEDLLAECQDLGETLTVEAEAHYEAYRVLIAAQNMETLFECAKKYPFKDPYGALLTATLKYEAPFSFRDLIEEDSNRRHNITLSNERREKIDYLIENNLSQDPYGTALCVAINNAYSDIVTKLIEEGISKDPYGDGLAAATTKRDISLLERLLNQGISHDPYGVALRQALKNGHADIACLLIRHENQLYPVTIFTAFPGYMDLLYKLVITCLFHQDLGEIQQALLFKGSK